MFSRPVLIGRGLGIFVVRARYGVLKGHQQFHKVSGGYSGGETPVPIPNTEVKTARADGTWGVAPWESRSPPGFFVEVWEAYHAPPKPLFFVLFWLPVRAWKVN